MRYIVFAHFISALKHLGSKDIVIKENNGGLSDYQKKGDFVGGAVHHKAEKAHYDLVEKGFYNQRRVAGEEHGKQSFLCDFLLFL